MVIMAALVAALAAFVLSLLILVYIQHLRRNNIFFRLRRHRIITGGQVIEQPYFMERLRNILSKLAAPIAERGPVPALDFRMKQADDIRPYGA